MTQRQANESRDSAGTTVDARLIEAYRWLIVPEQDGTEPIKYSAMSLAGGGLGSIGSLGVRDNGASNRSFLKRLTALGERFQ